MPRRSSPRNPLFSGRRFTDDVVKSCVRWYLRLKLSYRDMAEIAWELGVLVAPRTIMRWVIRYAQGRWKLDVSLSCRRWKRQNRRILLEPHTRDITAAKTFFRKALKHHGEPRTITLDGFEPRHAASRRMYGASSWASS